MGVFDVPVRIANPASPGRASDIALMVDTGATLASLPRSFLESIGVQPGTAQTFILGDGHRVQRATGLVLATLNGVTMPIQVMFAEENDTVVLGTTALEILGFGVDPVQRRLVPRPLHF